MSNQSVNRINHEKNPVKIRKLIAELPSSYSDLSCRRLKIRYRTANEALCVLYVMRFWEYWETEKIVRSIAHKAYLQKYEGKWEIVQVFLEQKSKSPQAFEELYIMLFGAHTFFGNFLRMTQRILYTFDCTEELSVVDDKRKFRRPQRKRGYDDKGSLRQSHEYHGDRPVGMSERLDRRDKVNHPLIEVKSFSVAEMCSSRTADI